MKTDTPDPSMFSAQAAQTMGGVLRSYQTKSVLNNDTINLVSFLQRPIKLFLARYEQLKIAGKKLSTKGSTTTIYMDSSGKFLKKFQGFLSKIFF